MCVYICLYISIYLYICIYIQYVYIQLQRILIRENLCEPMRIWSRHSSSAYVFIRETFLELP